MSRRVIKNSILFFILLLYIVLYKLFIFHNYMKYSSLISVSFFIFLLLVSYFFLGFRKDKPTFDSRNITRSVLFYLGFTFLATYGLGFIVGFLKNAYSRDFLVLLDNIIAPFLIIILVELFRYIVIWANKDKKTFLILFTVLITAFELIISVRSFSLGSLEEYFSLVATIVLPIIIKNMVLSYLSYHVGYKIPILYRVVMDLSIYIVPVIPDLGDYLNSLILISLPIVIYISAFSFIDERKKKIEYLFEEDKFSIWDIPIILFLGVLAALVSGFFPFYMIGVGSASMSPSINKGDAVIIQKINKSTNIKKGDIIAFRYDKKTVIHRVDDISTTSKDVVYTTKGDANNSVDSNTIKKKDIKGIVKLKIPFIAYPTVWLSEYLNSKRR